ncbi:MAG: alpha/beta hydrolase [Bacteroidetes bacterium]|nr:alpha/beta hydrolase [Bacteroidota bacterium]
MLKESIVVVGGYRHRVHTFRGQGYRQTLLCLHGFGSDGLGSFGPVAVDLAGRGFDVVAPDLLGFGNSSAPDGTAKLYSLEAYSQRTMELVIKLGLDRPIVIGHSMGGKIAASAVSASPKQFSGLVLVNSGGFTLAETIFAHVAPWVLVQAAIASDPFRKTLIAPFPFGRMVASRRRRDELRRLAPALRSLELTSNGTKDRLATMAAATLILWGVDDKILGRHVPQRIARLIPGSRLHYIRGGHAPMVSAPEDFCDAVDVFATQLVR